MFTRVFSKVPAYHCPHFTWTDTMLSGRTQMQGRIERRGSCWLFRYDTYVIVDGKRVRKQVAKKLATFSDKYHSKADVEPLADAILGGREDQSGMTVAHFLEHVYLSHVRETLRPSTVR